MIKYDYVGGVNSDNMHSIKYGIHSPQSGNASPPYTETLWTLLVVVFSPFSPVFAFFRLNDRPPPGEGRIPAFQLQAFRRVTSNHTVYMVTNISSLRCLRKYVLLT